MSRQGIADYLVTMRKPGDNDEPIAHEREKVSRISLAELCESCLDGY